MLKQSAPPRHSNPDSVWSVSGSSICQIAAPQRIRSNGPFTPRSVARHATLATLRRRVDHTRRFPELVKAVAELDASACVLDGEVATFDRQLISRFEWLRKRPKQEISTPPMFMVFDLLEPAGDDIPRDHLRSDGRG